MLAVETFLFSLGVACFGVGFLIKAVAYAFEVRREWADSDDAIRAEREAAHGQDF